MSVAPIVFRYQRPKALFFGLIGLAFFTVVAGAMIKALVLGDLPGMLSIVLTLIAVSIGASAADYLKIFIQNPIALQADVEGLSGYKFNPIPWSEVKDITALRGRKRHRYLGITLKNADARRTSLGGIARLKAEYWHWRYSQDIVVEGFLLKTNETEVIAQAVDEFRAAHVTG